MAVPVDGARIVFEAILNSFAGIDYESILTSFAPLIQDCHSSLFYGQEPASGQMFAYEKEEEYIAL
jgi:hypothetical protein